jgi:hypothetical protein
MKILLRIIVSMAALGAAAWVGPGIVLSGHDTAARVWTLLTVAGSSARSSAARTRGRR